ncbi:MAG: lipid-binding SYLF domain-containing protein [Steroidobacteraceae bacterium]|jgi:lipid-binding SYLF domain-containing protein|nr:lipid-binding SYLF domain-containing protein [Steroidobacteraceae bacterium]
MRMFAPATVLLAAMLAAGPAAAESREEKNISQSLQVLTELQSMPDLKAPDWLLQRAEGIAILPQVVKAGVVFGGRGGTGVLLVRQPDGRWSNPLFIGIGAGSFGWQFGVQATDMVFVFTTRRSVEGIAGGKLTLGGDAAAVAGPVGRSATAATDLTLAAEVYSYSRSQGLFAGVSLEGTYLFPRNSANDRFYGRKGILPSEILAPEAPLSRAPAPALIAEVARITAAPTAAAPAPAPGAAAPSAAPPATGSAQTFPMADPKPGEEPR